MGEFYLSLIRYLLNMCSESDIVVDIEDAELFLSGFILLYCLKGFFQIYVDLVSSIGNDIDYTCLSYF